MTDTESQRPIGTRYDRGIGFQDLFFLQNVILYKCILSPKEVGRRVTENSSPLTPLSSPSPVEDDRGTVWSSSPLDSKEGVSGLGILKVEKRKTKLGWSRIIQVILFPWVESNLPSRDRN